MAISFLARLRPPGPRLQRLGGLSLFAGLSQAELAIVDGLLHERHYLAGEVIFDEGDEGQALYFVLAGRVLICRQGQPRSGVVADFGPGAFFGELALLDGSPRAAQARAAEQTTAVVLFRDDFLGLLETNALVASKIALNLARHLGQRLRVSLLAKLPDYNL